MGSELISVIIPCYNVENYLNDVFLSIKNQTYNNFEVIFIDDGSTDGTREKLDEFTQTFKNAKIIYQSHQGISTARNNGIKNAKGKFLLFLDSDDIYHPELLSHLYNKIKEGNYDIAVCGYRKIKEKEHYKKNIKLKRGKDSAYLGENEIMSQYLSIKPFYWITWNKLLSHDLMKTIPNYPNLFSLTCKIGEDALFYSIYLSHCQKAIYIDEKLYLWRQRKTSITHTKFNDEYLTLLENEKFLETFDKNRFPLLQDYIKSKVALDNLILLFKFAVSDYRNPEAAKMIYHNFKNNYKYFAKSKKNPWYCHLTPIILPIAYLMIKRKFK